ncbi:hypothetical protein SH591_07555 [Sphingomonas sp. LY54]|uniref:hypothetical protein n=1 Tax=Sphingomonas sp. LY54 TaxID=3095343 RepID=UPI002D7A3FFE|nr:hypothetical protein [Sphingomonas sp. LY54]WRP30017.1 hypothetical protein SH591_07555 [Sphingomonas sp. LY54]
MCRIPYVRRREGRYVFRRRVHFRNLISKPVAVALQTADPGLARQRAALLSARFAIVKSSVDKMVERGRALTGAEIEALFRGELERELRVQVQSAYENGQWSSSALEIAALDGEAYRILRKPDQLNGMQEADRASLRAKGLDAGMWMIEDLIDQIHEVFSDGSVEQKLKDIGAPAHSQNVAAARTHLIRARAAACARVQRLFDENILDAADPIRALMADLGEPSEEVVRLLRGDGENSPSPRAPAAALESQFLIYDDRRFGDVIERVITALKAEDVWKEGYDQKRRIMQTFAWITGNRELGSYDHRDVAAFKTGLMQLPTTFRFGTLTKGAMARPFHEVVLELPPLSPDQRRNNKTINRDLSTMSTVAKHLEQTAWKPKVSGAKVMDFSGATIAIKESDSTDLRPPWTTAHLTCLFSSPLYTGGGAGKRRLKEGQLQPQVWHDAAYFAPLIWYYTHACREEICGLEVADVTSDHLVPHIDIRDNLTRGRDGEKAGEKRAARRRKLPIHPELIRLGFLDYVKAIAAEGHVALFPELYLFEAKRGGAQFYDRAWRFMVEWIADRLTLPVNDQGKIPDIHSIRSLGSSFYEVDGVNEIMRADIMGHARQGTNAKHYSKRAKTEGLDVVLVERFEFLKRYVPVITSELRAAPIQLLHIDQRSRVGSGRHRRIRNDAGTGRHADK